MHIERNLNELFASYEEATDGDQPITGWISTLTDAEVRVLITSADEGKLRAQHLLSLCYAYGHGVPQSWESCFEWTKKAAEGGEVRALLNVGNAYYVGRGVAQNYREARRWLNEACEHEIPDAQLLLGLMELRGEGGRKDEFEAHTLLLNAAWAGIEHAQYLVALMYAKGDGCNLDQYEAARWMLRAAAAGYSAALVYAKSILGRELTAEEAAEELKVFEPSIQWVISPENDPEGKGIRQMDVDKLVEKMKAYETHDDDE